MAHLADTLDYVNVLRTRWEQETKDDNPPLKFERELFEAGIISRCEYEFGPHPEHSDCERMMDEMSGDDGYEFYDIEYNNYMYGSSRYGFPIGD